MKKCCGQTYPDDYVYCTQCGKKLVEDFFGELFTEKDESFFVLFSPIKKVEA
jgi:predicted amidophosphoribosyltransferase